MPSTTNTTFYIAIYKNGGEVQKVQYTNPGQWYNTFNFTCLEYATAGDYFEVYVVTNSTGYSTSTNSNLNFFQGFLARSA